MRDRAILSQSVYAVISVLLLALILASCFLLHGDRRTWENGPVLDAVHLAAWRIGFAESPPMSYLETLIKEVFVDGAVEPDVMTIDSENGDKSK